MLFRIRRGGFTLVELLITTVLMTFAGAVVVGVLVGGMKVWRRAMDYGTQEQAVLIAAERIARDLRNARRFALVPFEGEGDRLAVPAVAQAEAGHGAPEEIGQLGYFLDARNARLCRSFIPYRLMRRTRLTARCQTILEDIERIRFDYFGSPGEEAQASWFRHWESDDPPQAVKGQMTLRGAKGQTSTHSFVIYLPMSGTSDEPTS